MLAPATHLYFDQPQEPDPEERGQYWASRFTETRKVFSFMPEDLYANADVERSGEPYDGMMPLSYAIISLFHLIYVSGTVLVKNKSVKFVGS